MAKQSFLSRLAGRIRKILLGPVRRVPEEPPTVPIPKQPPPGPDFFPPDEELELDFNRLQIWEDITGVPSEFGDVQEYWEIFIDSGAPIDESYGKINRLWRNFLRAFYLTLDESGGWSRDDWYSQADVVPALIDWQKFREVKRGTP